MISTLLDIEPSVYVQQEFAVPVSWPIGHPGGASASFWARHVNKNSAVNDSVVFDQYVVDVYFVQCSLSAVTTEAVLDIQTNSLRNPVSVPQPSKQWEIEQWSQLSPNTTWKTMVCVKVHLDGLRKSNDPLFTQGCFGFGHPSH
jgi:hypothetical protein